MIVNTYTKATHSFSFPLIDSIQVIEQKPYIGGLIYFDEEFSFGDYPYRWDSIEIGYETSFSGYYMLLVLYGITIVGENFVANRPYYWRAERIARINNSRSLSGASRS